MQPGRARTSGLGVPLLPLARWVGWVTQVRPTHGVLVLSRPSAVLLVCSVLGHVCPVHRCARVVYCVASAVSRATWLLFTGAPARCVVLCVRCPGQLDGSSPVCPLGVLCCVCGVLGHLAPVHRCACSVCCFACTVSWATWLLFTGVPARCVVLRVRCPGSLGSCSPVCPVVCCVVCALSWATWLLFTGVTAWYLVLRLRCPGPLGFCSPVRPLGVLCFVRGVLGHLGPFHRCARRVCCVACAIPLGHWCACSVCCVECVVSWVSWLLFTGVPAWFVVLCVRCPGPLGSCSPVCPPDVLCCVCVVLGLLAPVHRCVRVVCCVVCAVPGATWLLFTAVPARCVVLRVRCPGSLGSCSPVCPRGLLCCVGGVLGPLAPVHRCARSVCCFASAVSLATWLLLRSVPAGCVVFCVRRPGPLGSCSLVCLFRALLCLCAVSLAIWLRSTGVPARCVVLRVRCPGPLSSCSPVRPFRPSLCLCGVLGYLAPVHWCARSVGCVACAVSWATWLLFSGVPTRCVVLRVWCPGPLGSCAPGRPLRPLLCLCGVRGHLAPAHRCARSVCFFACVVSWATWLLFTGVPARCVVLPVRCPGPRGSCSPVCPLGVLCCVWGVLGHLAPVHRCAHSVGLVARTVSWAPWLLFTRVPARWVVLCVRCPGPLGSCSPVCSLCVLCFGLRLGCCCAGGRCRALTRPSRRRLFVVGRGWVPSGRALVHPDGGCPLQPPC